MPTSSSLPPPRARPSSNANGYRPARTLMQLELSHRARARSILRRLHRPVCSSTPANRLLMRLEITYWQQRKARSAPITSRLNSAKLSSAQVQAALHVMRLHFSNHSAWPLKISPPRRSYIKRHKSSSSELGSSSSRFISLSPNFINQRCCPRLRTGICGIVANAWLLT